jgi:ATP-dependent helicase/nuclease subunit A
MNPIEFVSAGAGSGKTYRLTSIIADALSSGSARASGILAMTFTLKAGAELRERARKTLVDRGRLDLATATGQARIGTVNAVCGQLLQRFSFELGLAPEQTVLDEVQSERMLRKALDEMLDESHRDALVHFGKRFSFEDDAWDQPVKDVVNAARANGIDADTLRPIGLKNAQAMLAQWPQPVQGADLTAQLLQAVEQSHEKVGAHVEERIAAGGAPQKNTQEALDDLGDARRALQQGSWKWKTWVSLAKLNAGAKLRADVQPVLDAAAMHLQHPEFHRDVVEYLELVFDLAATTLASYEEAKRGAGAQDFTDQEMLFLRALEESEDVRSALSEELDLVLVDEFQDTSPIQLALFVELAKLAKKSVWVGDSKQAIYGFRGTDASLIASVVDAIPGWGGVFGEPLTSSRRSVPSLVKLVNTIFAPAFPRLQPKEIELSPVRKEYPEGQAALQVWSLATRNADQHFEVLAPAIAQLLSSGVQVQDKDSDVWRPATAGDVAVLCRQNKHIPMVAAALNRWGIPCISSQPGLLSTPEALLVVACLRRMHDPADTVATAQVISLVDSTPADVWISDRLRHVQADQSFSSWKVTGDDAHPLVRRLDAVKERLMALSPAEALSLAKAESGVCRIAAQWSSSPKEVSARVANVEALMVMAETYESECRSRNRPATVAGLLQWLVEQARLETDNRAAATSGAVNVLTHHSAKGLEWPIVVLTGLDAPARSGLWSVRARTVGAFDAQQPLRDRFVHYWPLPYGRNVPDILKQVQDSPFGQEMQQLALDEHTRLLYVSCTRARDVMVMTPLSKRAPAWTNQVNASKLLFDGEGDIVLPSGDAVRRELLEFGEDHLNQVPPQLPVAPRRWFADRAPEARKGLWLRPSSALQGDYRFTLTEAVGTRIPLAADVDMAALGSAVHNVLALHLANPRVGAGLDEVERITARWGVAGAVAADAVLGQAQAMMAWVQRRWPGAPVYAEVPVEVKLSSGEVVRGQIDLLVKTTPGWVLVDHKSNPRGSSADDDIASAYGAQLDAYAGAVEEATGEPVVERWLFLPVAGRAARLERAEAEASSPPNVRPLH